VHIVGEHQLFDRYAKSPQAQRQIRRLLEFDVAIVVGPPAAPVIATG